MGRREGNISELLATMIGPKTQKEYVLMVALKSASKETLVMISNEIANIIKAM